MKPLLLALAFAATGLPQASFDVSSIKLHAGEVTFSADPSVHGRRVIGTACTLLDMTTYAYAMRYDQLSGGPAWASSDHYDLQAVAEGEGTLTTQQALQMVQALLAERFELKVRRELREVPVYALVVAKNGPKFKPAAPDATGGTMVRAAAEGLHMEAAKTTMESLAKQLSYAAGRPVVDRTNLAGFYVFSLDWFPANRIAPPDSVAPTMFDAVQNQLGLKLEPSKAPMEHLVIEHAARPSAN